jgi:2-methylcitrate dehydratase PrpD
MCTNLTDQFISYLDELRRTAFSSSIIKQAKRCLLDYLGVTFAGARILKEKGNSLVRILDDSENSASVIGFDRKASVLNAALINGICSHIAELDDGVRFGMIHPGSPVFSAILPIAEKEKVSGINFLVGIIIGYEAAVRIASAIQPSHYNIGYHPTSTCGAIGGAMGIAAMLDFPTTALKDTFSAVSVASSGMLKVIEDGSELKPINVGRAAYSAIVAAFTAQAGFKGLDDVLSGSLGFLSVMSENFKKSFLKKDKHNSYEIEKVYFKPYASCRHTHSAIEGALYIKKKTGLSPKEIKNIKVITYKGIIGKHDHVYIRGVSSAKMSLPFSIAVAIVTGKAGINEFSDEYITDSEVSRLTKSVLVISDKGITDQVPKKRAAIVEINTYDGTSYTKRIDLPKGEPENSMSEDEINEKFKILSAYGNKKKEGSENIIKIIGNIEGEIQDLFHFF